MIKVYPLTKMEATPFGQPEKGLFESLGRELLKKHGVELTDNPRACDLFVAHKYPLGRRFLYPFKIKYGLKKPILMWSSEPRYCTISQKHLRPKWPLPPVHIMNVYTNDVYLNNFNLWCCWITPPKLNPIPQKNCPDLSGKRIAAVLSYIFNPESRSLMKDGRELDLCALRQQLVLDGHQRGLVDIYGRGWPDGLSKGASRKNNWGKGARHNSKIQLLKDYQYNICLENTNFDYYCTEKIWEAIKGGCLPIYYGRFNRIYETFPKKSFIDLAEYESSQQLYDHLENMSKQEYCDRINKCIAIYNRFIATDSFENQFERIVKTLVERIQSIFSA
jgi:hypothetical protein